MSKIGIPSSYLLPIFLGGGAFFLTIGFSALNPLNLGWLMQGDHLTHYLGWAFFRESPWSLPLGANPNYGLDNSSSIVYSDSLPLFAIPFKLIVSLLPQGFQYFGLWLLFCLILQAVFAWKLLGLISRVWQIQLLGSCLFVFAPAMLWRVSEHLALTGHFVVLIALYLSLAKPTPSRYWQWYLLLVTCALIQFYLMAIAVGLWLAWLCGQTFIKQVISKVGALLNVLGGVAILMAIAWLAGYFMIGLGSISAGRFGELGMNGLAIFYAKGWSYFTAIPQAYQDYEGYNFLGWGCLLGLPILLIGIFRRPSFFSSIKANPFLFICLLLFLGLALTNQIKIGNHTYAFYLPEGIRSVVGIVRASGRLFWPIYYLLILSIVWSVVLTFSTKWAISILSVMALVQVIDTSAGYLSVKKQYIEIDTTTQTNWALAKPFKSPFWHAASARYQHVLLMPAANENPHWKAVAGFALNHGLATNAIYMGRIDQAKVASSNAKFKAAINQQQYLKNSLYILEDWQRDPALRVEVNPQSDFLGLVDGFMVLAPGWNACQSCGKTDMGIGQAQYPMIPYAGLRIEFARGQVGQEQYLSDGWAFAQDWGVWSSDNTAVLVFPRSTQPFKTLTIHARAFITPEIPTQKVEVWVNGQFKQNYYLQSSSDNQLAIALPAMPANQEVLRVEFKLPSAISPHEIGLWNDKRKLAVGIKSAIFR